MDIKKFIGWCIKGIKIKLRKMPKEHKRLAIYAIIALVLGGILGNGLGRAKEEKRSEKKIAQAVAEVQEKDDKKLKEVEKQLYDLKEQFHEEKVELPWNMVLVNGQHPMEEGYVPELMELEEGLSVDSRILDATKEMLADAKKAGLHIDICSGYRSVERQEQVFGDSM